MNEEEYLAGMKACQEGLPCPTMASDDFKSGYGIQYTHEQNMGAVHGNASDYVKGCE